MAIEDIIRQIGDDAMAKSDGMLSGARAEAEVVIEKAKKSAERFRAEAMQKAEERAKEHARRIETLAGLELRKEILKEKKSHIAEVFEKAENKIANLPSGEYLEFLKPIIIGAVESGNEEIVASKKHSAMFTSAFLDEINSELGSPNGRLRLSEGSGDFSGGFILREGRKETNLTLKSLFGTERDRLEPEVAGILFGKGDKDG